MIKLIDLITQSQQKIMVTNNKSGKTYEVSPSWYEGHKGKYTLAQPSSQLKRTAKSKRVATDRVADRVLDTSKPNKTLQQIPLSLKNKVSMKIDKLAQLGKQARERGQKAPNYNLCNITIPGTNLYCKGNKGIPRQDMPQFKGTPIAGSPADSLPKDRSGQVDTEQFFKKLLKKKGIKITKPVSISPDRLKATQSELVGVKVAGMSKVLEDPNHPAYGKITAPIYVSKDGYVLDGHHRWAAIVSHNVANPKNPIKMDVRVIDSDIIPLVKASNDFAQKMGIRAKKAETT